MIHASPMWQVSPISVSPTRQPDDHASCASSHGDEPLGSVQPLTMAMTDQLLSRSSLVFDYGCGRGDDIRHLSALGYKVDGWDRSHRPHAQRSEADIVNIGYVINVIERPEERAETLCKAW